MSDINRTPWPDRVRVAAWAALVLVVVWPRLVGFTTDSDAFIDVARTFLEGKGLAQSVVDFWRPAIPDPLGMWPPVYPLAIAAFGALGVALPLAARLVSAISYVLFALAFHGLARRAGGRPFAFVTTLVVLLGPGLAQAGATAWSEPPYLFLLTLALATAWDLVHDEIPSELQATVSGILLGLAADTRYLGIGLVPLVFVLVARRARGRVLVFWTLGALVPVALWAAHNLAAFGRPFGPELPPGVRDGSQGLRATPISGLSVTAFHPISGVVVLPRMIAFASRSRAVTGASSFHGPAGSIAREPRNVGHPRVRIRSLIVTGTPSSAPAGAPRCHRVSDARAALRAPSASTSTNALCRVPSFAI